MIHVDIPMKEKTASQVVGEIRSNGPADFPQTEKTEQISVLVGNIAAAKLVPPHWVSCMTLSKSDGAWKIVSVVQRIDN